MLKESIGKNELTYSLLSDNKMIASRAFGIAFRVDDSTIEAYRGFGIDLEAASGERHFELPVPSVFLIDTEGTIRFRYFNPNYKIRIDPDELLAEAEKAAG